MIVNRPSVLRMRIPTHCTRKVNMSSSEPIILSDLLFSKIPGSPKRKSIPLFVELTPTQLHIFEAVGTKSGASSFTGSWPSDEFKKGKQIRTLWRDHEEDVHNVIRLDQPGRRSHMYKFHIKRPDGLLKFKCKKEECRDNWVRELTMTPAVCDLTTPGAMAATTLDRDCEVDVPSLRISIQDDRDPYVPPIQPHLSLQPWLERVRNEGEVRYYPLKRQSSTESDFPRSRSASVGDVKSESGYSSSDHELGYSARSRSVSFDKMPTWEQSQPASQPASPTDANTAFIIPLKVSRVPTKVDHEDNTVQLSELRNFAQHLSLDSLTENNLKSLSPVPEENEPDIDNDIDEEIVYLLQESLKYQIGQDGKMISLFEDLGIIIDIPPGAIPDNHPDDVTVKVNACVSGPFETPNGYELASPIFHIEPYGIKFTEKPVELSILHFIDITEEDHCSELKFISAPLKQNSNEAEGKGIIRFKYLDGGMFWPGRRVGKISLQHFCLIGIARLKHEKGKEKVTTDTVEPSMSIIRPKPALPSKEAYIALLYSPVSFPEQLPRSYHVIFSISLSHPVFIKNLENQLAKRFSTEPKFWRTSCKVNYAGDAIELEIPHDTLREYGCEVHTDLGCMISKQNVDDIRRSRFSRSDYASYIDYPPRILLRVHQTSVQCHTTPSKSTQTTLHPKLKLKGTVAEQCFNVPLPASDASQLLSPQHSQPGRESQSPAATPTTGYSVTANRRSLVSLPKQRNIHSMPDPKDLGDKVTPHLFPKWYLVGIQLGLQPVTLTGIELKYPHDIQRCQNEVFYEWISRSEENPTWMTLIETLKSDSIGERQLASELERTLF